MSHDVEVRKIPKKSIYIMIGIVVLGALALIATSLSQQLKMKEILVDLGHPNVTSITIFNKTPVQDEATGHRAELTKVSFKDLDTNKECFGLVLKDKKTRKYSKDIDCK